MNFNLLRLGVFVLEERGGEPGPYLQRIAELEEQWAKLQADAGRLQQEIYEAVSAILKGENHGTMA